MALANLESLTGIKGEWQQPAETHNSELDGVTILHFNSKTIRLNTEVKREFRGYFIDQLLRRAKENKPFIIVAEKIFSTQKELLRQEGIAYLEMAGNIHLADKSILLWIEGQKCKPIDRPKAKTNRAFTKAGLKVVYVFLENDTYVNASYRELAAIAGVAIGTIKPTISALQDDGYLVKVSEGKMMLQNKKQLLESWLVGYANILKPSLLIGTYQFSQIDQWKNIDLPADTVWGAEPAAERLTNNLSPQQWTLYTTDSKADLIKSFKLVPKATGNLTIYKKFFSPVFQGWVRSVAPELVTYADLIISGEPRSMETAKLIFEERLAKKFDGL
jgi:hypothetical protein